MIRPILVAATVVSVSSLLCLNLVGAHANEARRPLNLVREVRPLPGNLDNTPVFNSNNPELVGGDGILLSTFPREDGIANLDFTFAGRFDVFAHHIAGSQRVGRREDLYLGLLVGNTGEKPVVVDVVNAASYLTRPEAPYIALPRLIRNDDGNTFAGPGDRATSDLLRNKIGTSWKKTITVSPGKQALLQRLAVPVPGSGSQQNARTYIAQLQSDGPVRLALVACFAHPRRRLAMFLSILTVIPPIPIRRYPVPKEYDFVQVLKAGKLVSPRERPASHPEDPGVVRYGRVSGVTIGSSWQGTLADDGLAYLALPEPEKPISYVLSSLVGGTFGTDQVQSAPLAVRYDDSAYKGHGNYAVRYDLVLPLKNTSNRALKLRLFLETPIKSDIKSDVVRFFDPPYKQVVFRGTIKVTTRSKEGQNSLDYFHLVQRYAEAADPFFVLQFAPRQEQTVRVEFIYPPDCTPPQLLTISSAL